ncbi:hypothetical protein TNIN_150311 [Trichonephila inaurata madagascariensis]|uniref:Uncharacterized protein n=1 Tax=Trichonephila inaurata madagascariensis TaxID=2747483 RepID=A0A8X6X5G9_9ARAC|nr:hypothetical protein TNIN_150311 [Trichonephila inaurata madagascariensis]
MGYSGCCGFYFNLKCPVFEKTVDENDDVVWEFEAWLKRSSFSGALMTRPYLDTLGKALLESLGSESISLEIEEFGLANVQSFKGSSGVSVDCTSKGQTL